MGYIASSFAFQRALPRTFLVYTASCDSYSFLFYVCRSWARFLAFLLVNFSFVTLIHSRLVALLSVYAFPSPACNAVACERRRISGCHWFRRQPEIRLRSQASNAGVFWRVKARILIRRASSWTRKIRKGVLGSIGVRLKRQLFLRQNGGKSTRSRANSDNSSTHGKRSHCRLSLVRSSASFSTVLARTVMHRVP